MSILQKSKYFSNEATLNFSLKTIFQSTAALLDLSKWRHVPLDWRDMIQDLEVVYKDCKTIHFVNDLDLNRFFSHEVGTSIFQKMDYVFTLKASAYIIFDEYLEKDPDAHHLGKSIIHYYKKIYLYLDCEKYRAENTFLNILSTKSIHIKNLDIDLFVFSEMHAVNVTNFPNLENFKLSEHNERYRYNKYNKYSYSASDVGELLKNNFGLKESKYLKTIVIKSPIVHLLSYGREFHDPYNVCLNIDDFPRIEEISTDTNCYINIFSNKENPINYSLKKLTAKVLIESDIIFDSVDDGTTAIVKNSPYSIGCFPKLDKISVSSLRDMKNVPRILPGFKTLHIDTNKPIFDDDYTLEEVFPNLKKIVYEFLTRPHIGESYFKKKDPKLNAHSNVISLQFDIPQNDNDIYFDYNFLINYSFPNLKMIRFPDLRENIKDIICERVQKGIVIKLLQRVYSNLSKYEYRVKEYSFTT